MTVLPPDGIFSPLNDIENHFNKRSKEHTILSITADFCNDWNKAMSSLIRSILFFSIFPMPGRFYKNIF